MSKLIGQGASLILQIIIVVAAVLVFSWFDPFDLLAPTRLTLKNTPIQVQSIREIGQLITAEYYGEVISSSLEVKAEKEKIEVEEFNENTGDIHEDFKQAILDFSTEELKGKRKRTVYNAFVSANPDLVLNPLYDIYLYFINENLKDKSYKIKELDKALNLNKKEKLLKDLYQNKNRLRDELMNSKTDEFKSLNEESIKKVYKKVFRRSRLVMIGRGWVKVGFDFREFTDRNFKYDKARKRIHFIGLKPQIISATINPWFIPEEGVEGFEFLVAERHARLNPEYTKDVKRLCLKKLRKQAMDKQILVRAQENAESNLKDFFSLLLDEDIAGVHFNTDYLDYTLDVILSDTVLSDYEIFTVDSAISYFNRTYKSDDKQERISDFISSLKRAKHEFYGMNFTLNSRSALLFSLIQDRVIDSLEVVHLESGYLLSLKNTLWLKSELLVDSENMKQKVNIDSVLQVRNRWDMEIFCDDLNRFINKLPVEVNPKVSNKTDIKVKTGENSISAIYFRNE